MKPDESTYNLRFGGIARLYGLTAMDRLRSAHVCVIGIGGVGSWIVEALARSGIGILTLVDPDEVCISNVNRQIHAVDGCIGTSKIETMRDRALLINPQMQIQLKPMFLNANTVDDLLAADYDYVVDAIDSADNKCVIIEACRLRQLPLLCVGSAGGRTDPGLVTVMDITKTKNDFLIRRIRKQLRRYKGYPRNTKKKWNIACVTSDEPTIYPHDDGSTCTTKPKNSGVKKLDCEFGFGAATFVTGTFGFAAAAHVVNSLAKADEPLTPPLHGKKVFPPTE